MVRDDINDAERCAVCDSLYDPHNRGPACPYCEIDKLPKTADGAYVVPGMTVWLWCSFGDGQPRQIHEMVVFGITAVAASDGGRDGTTMHRWAHKDSYSTREDAEAARGRHRCE
jgi:hypothetical protein